MHMTPEEIAARIATGRAFMRMPEDAFDDTPAADPDYSTDQQLRKPQPPLFKAPMGDARIDLPRDFRALPLTNDLLTVLGARKSSRVYRDRPMTLLELSYLLWATQGVRAIRGNNYATLRTVACGGARHEFECYLAVLNVENVPRGWYHYMPDHHALERIGEAVPTDEQVSETLCDQKWAAKAGAVFYYSVLPYRAEWRYGIWAHRTALIDAGHITQNLYVACAGAGLGTCAIAAVDHHAADPIFTLDGEDEFIFYAAPVGAIDPADAEAENAFYAFL